MGGNVFSRRSLFSAAVGILGSAISIVVVVPSLLSALSPLGSRSRASRWRGAGRLEEFEIGRVQPAVVDVQRQDWSRSLESKTVFVYRRSVEEVVVYSRSCTDLSCPLVFDQGSECFFCPCHGAIFGKEGKPLKGPPVDPLFRYDTRVRDGELEIDLNSLPPMV
jgi:menaquinol-cytochrome c reductase iron-sulfur subunit